MTKVSAQQFSVSGVVTDDVDGGLPGVTVLIKGKTQGTITDFDGNYKMNVNENDVLIYSFVGFKNKEIPVNSRTRIDVQLELDILTLETVVKVGYAEIRKSNLTSSISSVDAAKIEDIPVANVVEAMQGRAAGVQITQNSGSPGAGTAVSIRGVGTINNSNPLYVVDGIIVDDINYLNSNDIANIEVLKDAGVAALYGSRAANGVVVVSTKSGDAGEVKVNVGVQYGVQDYWNRYDMMDTYEFQLMRELGGVAASTRPDGLIEYYDRLEAGVGFDVDRDWIDEISQIGSTQKYNASFGGGSKKVKYYFGSSYYNENGIIRTSDFEKVNGIFKLDVNPNDVIDFGININYTATTRNTIPEGKQSIYREAIVALPNIPDLNPDLETNSTPLRTLLTYNNEIRGKQLQVNLNAGIQIADGIRFESRAGFTDLRNVTSRLFASVPEIATRFRPDISNDNFVTGNRRTDRTDFKWQWDNIIKTDKQWGKHTISNVVVFSLENYFREDLQGFNRSALDNNPNTAFLDAGFYDTETNNWATEWAQVGAMTRLAYDFDNRLLFEANFRADASSRFRKGNRLGFFPTVTAGWVISEEDFISTGGWLDFLKIRGSWGQLGNSNTPGINQIKDFRGYTILESGLAYGYGAENNKVIYDGFAPLSISNTLISWESTTTYNAGVDAAFFEGKLNLTADAFIRQTDNMLLNVPAVGSAGQTTDPLRNAGSVVNRGIEGVISYSESLGELDITFNGNVTFIQNEVTSLGNANEPVFGANVNFNGRANGPFLGLVTKTEVGQPIGSYYGWVTDGIFQTQEEADASLQDANPGDFRFVDLNGDGKLDNFDRTFIGNFIPDVTYGFGVDMSYRNFDIALFFQGVWGNENFNVLNYHLNGYNGSNSLSGMTAEFWRPDIFSGLADDPVLAELAERFPPVASNTIPKAQQFDSQNGNYNRSSDFYVEDGSFLRLKNVQIGYTLPTNMTSRMKVDRIKIFATATNLLTFTKYGGLDPEIGGGDGNNLENGIDYGTFPQARKVTMGFNLSF